MDFGLMFFCLNVTEPELTILVFANEEHDFVAYEVMA